MSRYQATTDFGRFLVTVGPVNDIDFRTREMKEVGQIITVGGRNKCVSIKVPHGQNTAHFLNVKRTDGGCELDDKVIRGPLTVKMISLAFTVLREVAPNVTHVMLEDMSDFPCKRHDGSTVGISLALYEAMFHSSTWYERHFYAILINDTLKKLYISAKPNFEKKPPVDFDFNNSDLNLRLREQLIAAPTWSAFFAGIYELPDKCEIIFPWYKSALGLIFNNVNFERQNWIINLSKCDLIEYEKQNGGGVQRLGGGRTRKRRQGLQFEEPDYEANWTYSYSWLHRNT